ncbi:type II toxin-antitoxin system HicA family toxin [Candidatus Peregrinibacteria bacterium]|jgi:predicted RNA binding protein YcfA (HicA-like mRNA interferase family)|nr:type II toxin-antitoxin system HicA family toxin [Candidatus Peregrinibacteria bacterium]
MPLSQYKHLSGDKVVKILCKHFHFVVVSQKGSHVKLRNDYYTTIVPRHKELAYGTFTSILELAHIHQEEFYKYL